jgi:hypothetical protein
MLQLVCTISYKEKQMKNILRFLFVGFCLFTTISPLYAQWVHTSGPNGADITSLVFNKGDILAGTFAGGVYISTNNGSSWVQSNEGLTNTSVLSLLVNDTNIYAGTNGGLYRSTNNGSSWNYIFGVAARALAVNGKHLYAAREQVYTSTDNGSSWNVGSGMTGSHDVFGLAVSDSSIFAGTYGDGIFRSTDNGASWIPINTGLTNLCILSIGVNNRIIFAGTNEGVFVSTNNGSSWTKRDDNSVNKFATDGFRVYAGMNNDSGVFVTTDNGLSWNPMNSGLTNLWVFAFAIDSSKIFAGTNNGVSLSTNKGSNWTDVSNGIGYGLDVPALGVLGSNIFAGGSSGGIFRSSDNGAEWSQINSGMCNFWIGVIHIDDNTIYADAGPIACMFESTNDGTSWNIHSYANAPATTLCFAVSHSITTGTNIFMGSDVGLFRSIDNCVSWTQVGFADTSVSALLVSPVVGDTGGTNIFASCNGGLYRSANNGTSWTLANSGIPVNTYIFCFAVSGTSLFTGTSRGVFLSTDNGTNWTAVNSGLPYPWVSTLVVSGINLFAGNFNGVFLSRNNGSSWSAVNTGLASTNVQALAVSSTNLFAGFPNGGGVWRRPLSEIVSVEKLSTDLPAHFSLDQNYPNPFNPTTTISFSIPFKSFVSLKVFDLIGREIATIISEEISAGSYSKQWNAANMSSGIYFYRLQAGTYIETKKLVLLR